jgi:hypothetical protein
MAKSRRLNHRKPWLEDRLGREMVSGPGGWLMDVGLIKIVLLDGN